MRKKGWESDDHFQETYELSIEEKQKAKPFWAEGIPEAKIEENV